MRVVPAARPAERKEKKERKVPVAVFHCCCIVGDVVVAHCCHAHVADRYVVPLMNDGDTLLAGHGCPERKDEKLLLLLVYDCCCMRWWWWWYELMLSLLMS